MTCSRGMVCITIYSRESRTTCKASVVVAFHPTFYKSSPYPVVEECITDVSSWCASKRLQLNATKTEILWFGSAANLLKLSPGRPECHRTSDGRSIVTLVCWSTRSCQCASMWFSCQLVSDMLLPPAAFPTSASTSRAWCYCKTCVCVRWCCRDWITLTPSLQDYQRQHWRVARPLFGNWLPLSQRIEFKLCLLVHKIQLGRSPRYLSDLLTLAADVPGRPLVRSPGRGVFIVPRTSRKFGDRAFSVAAPRAWNRLPMEPRHLRVPRHCSSANWFLFTAELQNWTVSWTDCVMRPWSTVDAGGALEILFVLYYCIIFLYTLLGSIRPSALSILYADDDI